MRSTLFLLLICLNTYVLALDQQTETSPAGTEYLIYIPDSYDGSTAYPLLIYLHGAQAINSSINISLNKGLPRVIRLNSWFADYPMIVVSPHLKDDPMVNNNDQEWDAADVDEVIQHIIDTYTIDEDRVHGSGISLGAKGIWDYALAYPTRLAGLIPISGNAPTSNICTLTDMAILAIHGEGDNTILISGTKDNIRYGPADIVSDLENCPSSTLLPPRLITLEGKNHGGWDEIYDLSSGYNIYEWLLAVEKNNSTNYDPMLNLGDDQSILLSGTPFIVQSFAMDPNGTITDYDWSQLSGPSITFADGNPNLDLSFSQAGTYQFQLTVTDDEARTSTDDIQIEVLNSSVLPSVTGFQLINADDNTVISTLSNGSIISFEGIGTENLDIEAIVSNMGVRASVRLAMNNNRNFNTMNETGSFYSYAGEKSNPPGAHLAFTPTLGTNILTGTAYLDRNALGGSGVTFQLSVVVQETDPLPVEFLKFTASSGSEGVRLEWLTTEEINNSHFEIFRGNDFGSLNKIAEIKPNDSRLPINSYEYLDREVTGSIYYYKLRNVDVDGSFQDYKIISVRHLKEVSTFFKVFPNPVTKNKVNIESSMGSLNWIKIQLLDIQGREIKSWYVNDFTNSQFSIPSGVYFLRMTTPQLSKSVKIVSQ